MAEEVKRPKKATPAPAHLEPASAANGEEVEDQVAEGTGIERGEAGGELEDAKEESAGGAPTGAGERTPGQNGEPKPKTLVDLLRFHRKTGRRRR